MNSFPLVSIITPCYNSAPFISQTIDSVLKQTYENWELLITDDCSTDNSVEIIRSYIENDSRIKLFKTEKNTGHPSIPRNISLSHAMGEFIAFLDSDDIWDEHKLMEQIDFIIRGNCDLICSYCRVIREDGKVTNRILKTKNNASYKDMLKMYELISPTILCSKRIGKMLSFPSCEKEDYIEWLRITKMGVHIYSTRTVNASYRVCNASRSRNKKKMLLFQWKIYRESERLRLITSVYYLAVYVIKTILKNY